MYDKKSFMPAYLQVKEYFLRAINEGRYVSNEKIPTEQEIADEWNISKTTVRQGIQQLIHEKVLYGKRGVGIFVSQRHLELDTISFAPFSRVSKGVISSQVHVLKKIRTASDIFNKIPSWKDKDLWYIERLRFLEDLPAMYEVSYLPCQLFPLVEKKDLLSSKYAFVVAQTNRDIAYSNRIFLPFSTDEKTSKYLNLPINTSIIKIESVGYLDNDDIFEYVELYHHPVHCMIKGCLPYKGI